MALGVLVEHEALLMLQMPAGTLRTAKRAGLNVSASPRRPGSLTPVALLPRCRLTRVTAPDAVR